MVRRGTRKPDRVAARDTRSGTGAIARPAETARGSFQPDWLTAVLGLAVSLIAGIVYVATAARDVVVGDSGEFMNAALTFGVAHPSGYPLLTLLGHFFSWLPVGPAPFRVNLVAVVSGAATVGVVFLIARRLGASHVAALIAALALAFHPLFWEWSLTVEAFPLNNLLAATVVYFLLRWESQPHVSRHLIMAGFFGGLGASNHLTIVFLAPATLAVVWRRRAHVLDRPWLLFASGAAAAVGLVPYLYIPWAASRHPFLNWGSVSSLEGLVAHFLRRDYGIGNLVAAGSATGSPVDRLVGLAESFTLLEGILVLLGAREAYRRIRWYFWFSVLIFAVAGPAFVSYCNIDVSRVGYLWVLQRFFLLSHLAVAPLAALGFVRLSEIVARHVTRANPRRAQVLVAASTFALIAIGAVRTYPKVDQSRNHAARNFAEDVLASLEPHSVLLAPGDEVVFPVAYVQAVEGQRPDVTLVMLGVLKSYDWYIRQLRRRDPDLVIPFDRYDPSRPSATMKALVDANPGRPFALIGTPLDDSLSRSYWFYHHGLVSQIEPMSKDVQLNVAAAENERLLRTYRIPTAGTIKAETFEIGILSMYAVPPKVMGDQYQLAHLDDEARRWYRRALAISPQYSEAAQALQRSTPKQPEP